MFYPYILYPILPTNYDIPPTIYSILESLVNYNVEEKTKIENLARVGHSKLFTFNYPLSANINKDDFETLILNHFLMRRIGYETVTAWKIALNVKLNEIMPMYNKLFDSLEGWNLFEDGESVTRTQNTDNTNTVNGSVTDNSNNSLTNNTTSNNTSDRRFSELPQNQLADLRNGTYVTDYNYDTNNDTSNSTSKGESNTTSKQNTTTTDKGNITENIKRTPADKINIYKTFIENKNSIYTMIFDELDSLFYGLV